MTHKGYKIKEKTLVTKFVKWLNTLRGCLAYKRAAGRDRRGKPDVTGCLQGIRLEIELKIGDNTPTPIQAGWLKKWQDAGAITGWANDFDSACDLVKKEAKKRDIKIEHRSP